MTFSAFDSPLYSIVYGDPEVRALFTDTAEVRALLVVEGTLAKVQGELGIIPLDSSLYIHRASMEVQIDAAGLAAGMAQTGNPVPTLVAAFRKAIEAPEHAKYVHWGANAQDVVDTAFVLRLRQYIRLLDTRIENLIDCLKHEEALEPLQNSRAQLDDLRTKLASVRFGRAADKPVQRNDTYVIAKGLAAALRLSHSDELSRSLQEDTADLAAVMSKLTISLADIGRMDKQSFAAEILTTMALYSEDQANLLHNTRERAHENPNIGTALDRLVLAQTCIATCVALKHATAIVKQS